MTQPPNPNSIKQGDTKPLDVTLSDDLGPINLAGSTVQMRMAPKVTGAGHAPFIGGCTVLQGVDGNGRITNKGRVRYAWAAGQTAVPGVYGLEWVITFADGTKQTVPNDRQVTFEIEPAAT